jgi:branched-chain amino acid aminotransferase
MAYFLYNQQFYADTQTVISPFDRGFALGDGVFETIKVTQKKPELWDAHISRLAKGCLVFQFKIPPNLYNNAIALIEKNNLDVGVLKIILSRQPTARGLGFNGCFDVNVSMTLSPLPSAPVHINAIISDIKRNDMSPLAQIKSLNYGDNMLAFNKAIAAGCDDALMLNSKNQPCCFTVGNIVIENKYGELITPPPQTGCLEGAFLTTIPNLLYRNFDLSDAVKIWRSNSISGLVPVIMQ